MSLGRLHATAVAHTAPQTPAATSPRSVGERLRKGGECTKPAPAAVSPQPSGVDLFSDVNTADLHTHGPVASSTHLFSPPRVPQWTLAEVGWRSFFRPSHPSPLPLYTDRSLFFLAVQLYADMPRPVLVTAPAGTTTWPAEDMQITTRVRVRI